MVMYTEPNQCSIRYDSAASGNTPMLDSQIYYLQCTATCVTYHHLLDSSYRQLLVSNYGCVPRHDRSGYTTDPHIYLVRGSLAASTPWPQAVVAEV